MIAWGVVVAIALILQRAWWPAVIWALGTLSGNGLMQLMKHFLAIERPHLTTRVPDGFSFPSGHASLALIFAGLMSLVLWPSLALRARRALLYAVALYVMLITASRLYLGAHWTSDLLAGWALGSAVLALCWLLLQHAPARWSPTVTRPRATLVLLATLATWSIIAVTYIQPQLDQALWHYAPRLDAGRLP